jgi:uncharacterized membrane protein YuzA (DUF378 family)
MDEEQEMPAWEKWILVLVGISALISILNFAEDFWNE